MNFTSDRYLLNFSVYTPPLFLGTCLSSLTVLNHIINNNTRWTSCCRYQQESIPVGYVPSASDCSHRMSAPGGCTLYSGVPCPAGPHRSKGSYTYAQHLNHLPSSFSAVFCKRWIYFLNGSCVHFENLLMKLQQGNVFGRVCQSFCPLGGSHVTITMIH